MLKSKAKKFVLLSVLDCEMNAEGKMYVLNTLPGRFAKKVLSNTDHIFFRRLVNKSCHLHWRHSRLENDMLFSLMRLLLWISPLNVHFKLLVLSVCT